MRLRGRNKLISWLISESKQDRLARISRDNFNLYEDNSRLRKELSHTEALLAEANRKLRAGGRACADRHKQKIWAKAAELRGE